jgi:hypothetical protein
MDKQCAEPILMTNHDAWHVVAQHALMTDKLKDRTLPWATMTKKAKHSLTPQNCNVK